MKLSFTEMAEQLKVNEEATMVSTGRVLYKDAKGALRYKDTNVVVNATASVLAAEYTVTNYIGMQQAFAAFMAGFKIGVDYLDTRGVERRHIFHPDYDMNGVHLRQMITMFNRGKWFRVRDK